MSTPSVNVRNHTRTSHLDHLDVEVARLVDLARAATDPLPPAVAVAATERTVVDTLRLDGSPIETLPGTPADLLAEPAADVLAEPAGLLAEPSAAIDAAPRNGQRGAGTGAGSWASSLGRLDDAPDETIVRLEAAGALRAYTADDLVSVLADDPSGALSELHRRLTAGLLAGEVAGRHRTTDQAVHDTSIGRLLYHTVAPEQIGEELDELTAWMAGPATELPPLHASGLIHLEVLRIHPFEAANGRLARAAARLWLRLGGLDPDGLAVAEMALVQDRLGYHEEVASTLRRRDAGIWLERWAEAVAAGLRHHLREAGWLAVELPARFRSFLAGFGPGQAFTIADYRAHLDAAAGSPEGAAGGPGGAEHGGGAAEGSVGAGRADAGDSGSADADLGMLLDAGVIERVPGGRGLRFTVTGSVE